MEVLSTTAAHPLPEGQVTLLGAVDRVTGAMSLYETQGKSVLIDCGSPIGEASENWTMPSEALRVDAVLLTHGHNDHISALPDLFAAGFNGPIYGTYATLELTRLNCRDGMRIQGHGDRDIRAFCKQFDKSKRPIRYNEPLTDIAGLEASFTFREAGHIIGSSSIDIETADHRVLFSGDLGRPNSPILRDYNTHYPTGGREIDLIVMESTYGNREHKQGADDVEKALERAIKHALRDGGHILIPAFSIGRTQTLLYHLNTMIESGRLRDLPVAVDSPLGIKITELYQRSKSLFDKEAQTLLRRGDDPLEFDELYAVRKSRHSVQLRDVKEPMVIIAGSGMCTGGRIVGHLVDLMPKPETCVLFVGYQGRGTPGRAILEAASHRGTVRLGREHVQVNCEITSISGLSAHADRQEMKAWLDAVPPFARIALHHGEPDVQREFAQWLQR